MKPRCLMSWMLAGLFILGLAGDFAWAEDRVTVKEVPPQDVVSVRETVPVDRIGESMDRMYQELVECLNKNKLAPAGPRLALYHSPPKEDIDIEACVPVSKKGLDSGKVKFQTLPGGKMARLMYVGPYEKIKTAYQEIFQWMADNGYKMAGPSREIYLKGPPKAKPEEYQTEIFWPVRKK